MARQRTPLTVQGFRGMRFSRWSGQADPGLAYFAYNAYVDSAGPGSAYRSRPGRYRISATTLGGGSTTGQLAYQFTKLDGTQTTVAICGGKFYTLNWGTGTWTETLSAANLSGASITLSTTARCYAVTLNDQMIVSDGTNIPWMWDGTAGGGLTSLTNCPVLYGQPTVHATKLFGIKNSDRGAIVWSEENDPTLGYDTAPYSNYFVMSQTGSDPLFAVRGTNEGLYYWRQTSVGIIRGASNQDFQTAVTGDQVGRVGTRSPRGVLYYQNTFYFPDEFGRPWMFQPGGQMVPLWEQIALAFPMDTDDDAALQSPGYDIGVTATDILHMQTVPVSVLGGVLFGNSPSNQSGADLHGGTYVGTSGLVEGLWFWGLGTSTAVGSMGAVLNSVTNLPEVLCVDDTGTTFSFGKRGVWQDQHASGTTQNASMTLIGPRQGASNSLELLFDQVDVVVDARLAATVLLGAEMLTSRSPINTSVQTQDVATTLTVQEKRVPVGLNRSGRWGQLYVEMNTAGNFPLALHGYTTHVYPVATGPKVS